VHGLTVFTVPTAAAGAGAGSAAAAKLRKHCRLPALAAHAPSTSPDGATGRLAALKACAPERASRRAAAAAALRAPSMLGK